MPRPGDALDLPGGVGKAADDQSARGLAIAKHLAARSRSACMPRRRASRPGQTAAAGQPGSIRGDEKGNAPRLRKLSERSQTPDVRFD